MVLEVHSGHRPAQPGRALWVSALLLGLTLVLAGSMSAARARDPLGPRVAPEGWPISFRAPRSFHLETPLQTAHGPAIFMLGVATNARQMLMIRLIPSRRGGQGMDWVRSMITLDTADETPLETMPRGASGEESKFVGPFEGVEAHDSEGTVVSRAAAGPDGVGIAVTLTVEGVSIDPATYRVFDLVCASIEVQ